MLKYRGLHVAAQINGRPIVLALRRRQYRIIGALAKNRMDFLDEIFCLRRITAAAFTQAQKLFGLAINCPLRVFVEIARDGSLLFAP
jgi:hypothetical protein